MCPSGPTVTGIDDSGAWAGPCVARPSVVLKRAPWHGQANSLPVYWTVQPAWVHTALNARTPLDERTTMAGSPLAGSWKVAAPPAGTEDSGPMSVPVGLGAVDGPGPVVDPGPAVVAVVVRSGNVRAGAA